MKSQHVAQSVLLFLGCFIGFHILNRLDVSTSLLPRKAQESGLGDSSFFSRCPDFDSTQRLPQPTVLVSKGRSGSTPTWQIMGNLTGMETLYHLEYTGQNVRQQNKFFAVHKDRTWFIDLICDRRRVYRNAGIVGLKWKLFPMHFHFSGVQDTFRLIAQNKQPGVKVVYLTRNPLDRHISIYKHAHKGKRLAAHCRKDGGCLDEWLEASSRIVLPTFGLLRALRKATKENEEVEQFLTRMNVPHVSLSYEKLYGGDTAAVEEWKRIFQFLGQGPTDELTLEQLQGAMSTEVTFYKWHNKTLANYEQVRNVLMGTEFESLLH